MSKRIVRNSSVAAALVLVSVYMSGCADVGEVAEVTEASEDSVATSKAAITGCYTDGNPSSPDPYGQGYWCTYEPAPDSDLEKVKSSDSARPVCRAKNQGVWLAGYVRDGKCWIQSKDRSTIYYYKMPNTYAHYLIDQDMQHHAWVNLDWTNRIPGNSVMTGVDSGGKAYYACEIFVEGKWYPGSWSDNRCFLVTDSVRRWSGNTNEYSIRMLVRY